MGYAFPGGEGETESWAGGGGRRSSARANKDAPVAKTRIHGRRFRDV